MSVRHQKDDTRRTPRGSRGHLAHGHRNTASVGYITGSSEIALATGIAVFFIRSLAQFVKAVLAARRERRES